MVHTVKIHDSIDHVAGKDCWICMTALCIYITISKYFIKGSKQNLDQWCNPFL